MCLTELPEEFWVSRDHLASCWRNVKDGVILPCNPDAEEQVTWQDLGVNYPFDMKDDEGA